LIELYEQGEVIHVIRALKVIFRAYLSKKLGKWLGIKVKEGAAKRAKWPFIVIPLLYWILPDFMPMFPLDDILVTLASILWYNFTDSKRENNPPSRKDVIDIEGKAVDD
jgi:hypothetical protein